MAALRKPVIPILCLCTILVAGGGCVTLDLREATEPYVGREKPGAPSIAVVDVADRRDEPNRFGRAGYTVLSFSGDAGHKFRNSLIGALDHYGYDVHYVGPRNVLDSRVVAEAVRDAEADALLTAAVLELRLYSTDILFDPADVDFIAQVNLLDGEGRTVYTRHVHSRDDKRLWFNPGFGAMDMLDEVMDEAAAFVARDPELRAALDAIRLRKQRAASGYRPALAPEDTLAPGERIVSPDPDEDTFGEEDAAGAGGAEGAFTEDEVEEDAGTDRLDPAGGEGGAGEISGLPGTAAGEEAAPREEPQ